MDRLTDEPRRHRGVNNLLSGDTDHWRTYGSSIDDYDKTFRKVLGEKHIIDFVRGKPEPIVIDLMSSTEALASLFTQLPQQNKLGISVSEGEDDLGYDYARIKIVRSPESPKSLPSFS